MKLPRRNFLHQAACATALAAVSRIARAQAYPTRPVRWIVPFPAQSNLIADAEASAGEVLRIEPGFTIDRWKCTAAYKDPADAEHLFEGLRKAGLPDI